MKHNRPIYSKALDENRHRFECSSYALVDAKALLEYNGKRILTHLTDTISKQYVADFINKDDIPPADLWTKAEKFAEETLIELVQDWLTSLKSEHKRFL